MLVSRFRWLAIAIFVAGVFVLFSAASALAASAPLPCNDSDKGLDYYVKGVADGTLEGGVMDGQFADYCADRDGEKSYKTSGAYVMESYCNTTLSRTAAYVSLKWFKCAYGCENGVCAKVAAVVQKPSCKDTDGGDYIFTKGTLSVFTPTYGNQTVIEACADDKTMDELVCLTGDPTYAYTHKKTVCTFGCKDGACIATAPVVNIPVVNTKSDLGLYGFLKIGQNKTEVRWNDTISLTREDAMSVSGSQAAFNLYYTDKNYGDAKSGLYRNTIIFDGKLVSQQTNRQLDAGAKEDIWTQAYFPIGNGTYALKFSVDADGQVVESSETNNNFIVYVKLSGFETAPVVVTPIVVTPTYDVNAKPSITSPSTDEILTNFPRQATVRWTDVKNASKYEIEVACDICGSSRWSSINNWSATVNYLITPSLAGDNQFRVKARAVYPDGRFSQWSDFVYFRYDTSSHAQPTATQPATQPTTAPTTEPVASPTTEPTTQPAAEPTATEPLPTLPVAEEKPVVVALKGNKKPVGRMLCGNSAGGDGLYSACKNNTIKHKSGVTVKVRTYDSRNAWLTYGKVTMRVPLKKGVEFKTNNGKTITKWTFVKWSPKYGVYLQVDTISGGSKPMLPANDETKTNVTFGVGVNDYPDIEDDAITKNIPNTFVNMYTVSLTEDGTFKVLSYITKNTGASGLAKLTVKLNQMVYFEGYKTEIGAREGAAEMMTQTWTTPPYKNFSSVKNMLCQTNYSKIDEFLGGTSDYACASSLSTPYQD